MTTDLLEVDSEWTKTALQRPAAIVAPLHENVVLAGIILAAIGASSSLACTDKGQDPMLPSPQPHLP
jgi:hypothetical protein